MKDIYSSSSSEKKMGNKKPIKKISKPKRIAVFAGKAIVSLFLIGVITLCIVSTALTVYVMKSKEERTEISLEKEDLEKSGLTVFMAKDSDGNYVEAAKISSGEIREWVDYQDIPDNLKNAFIAIEDKRFYEHDGVDFKRTFMAFANYFLNFWDTKQGGSTITQQLIKNLTGEDDVSPTRKINEIFQAMSLEGTYSKEEILQAYLNVVSVGGNNGNYSGVGAAARVYFNKDVKELTIAECASIAAITKNPVKLEPINNPDNNKARRDVVLENMYDQGYITEAEYTEAINTPVTTNPGTLTTKDEDEQYQPFIDTVIRELVQDLNDDGQLSKVYDFSLEAGEGEETEWNKAWAEIKEQGYTIYTTMDMTMQSQIEDLYQQSSTFSTNGSFIESNTGDNPIQSAMTVYNYDGELKAIAGRIGEMPAGYVASTSYATQGTRSPGSAIKPLSVYTPAIEQNIVTYSTVRADETEGWLRPDGTRAPDNYGKANYGSITIAEAVERSANKIAAQLVIDMGTDGSYNFLKNDLKLSLTDGADNNPAPLSMGSLSYGQPLNKLTNAYQIFGNDGYFTESHSYTKITNYANESIYEKAFSTDQVISEDTSEVMNRLLYRVTHGSKGTASRLGDVNGIEVIGKTGTTTEGEDLSFVGATPDYIAGVWLGTEKGKVDMEAKVKSGLYRPYVIWGNVMQELLPSDATTEFTLDNVETRQYCTTTGLLANGNCPSETGYYRSGNVPGVCTSH